MRLYKILQYRNKEAKTEQELKLAIQVEKANGKTIKFSSQEKAMSLNSTSAKHDPPLQLCFLSLLRTRRTCCCAVHEHSRTRTQALHVIGQNIRLSGAHYPELPSSIQTL